MGSPSAIDDILNNPRFQGAIDSISGVTGFCDSLFVAFISFVAFFIISAALLRNVIAGAYAAYPKLFDWVAEAKDAGIQRMSGVSRVGPIAGFFLRLIPDFKNLSDFHDDTVEPKHYFMKSIPQMIGVVMIGVVIYNGYYRDAVSITAGFGSQLISRVLLTVDPVAVFDKIANSSGNPTFAHDSDSSDKGKLINSLSKDIYGNIISFYTDINGEQAKSDLGRQIEDWVTLKVNGIDPDWLVNGSWSSQKQVTRVFGPPDVSSLNGSDSDIVKTIGWPINIRNDFKFSTTKHTTEDWNIRVIVRFNKEAEKAPVSGQSNNLVMYVPQSYAPTGDKLRVDVSSLSGNYLQQVGTGTATDKLVSGVMTIDGRTSTSQADFPVDVSKDGLFYRFDSGSSSKIVKIVFNHGTDITFTDDSNKVADFKWGDKPQEKVQSGTK
jgi:hypothetical protein